MKVIVSDSGSDSDSDNDNDKDREKKKNLIWKNPGATTDQESVSIINQSEEQLSFKHMKTSDSI